MSQQTTRGDYAVRLDRVITWMAEHLDGTLDLARLADVACMSPYHFHRIYHAMQGETVATTVRRLRLHRAAVELIAGSLPVERIARRAGYASQEAFTRAFKAAYGEPPARYRASFVPIPKTSAKEDTMETTITPEVTIRETPPIRVAALGHSGDYQQIGATFERLVAMAAGQGLLGPSTRSFGIYYDDPASTPKGSLRSEACTTVPPGWTPSGELELREIRGGRYSVALHVGPYAELGRAYTWLFGTWLPGSGEEAADAPCVEEYLNDPHTLPPTEWKTEIWLPLR
ncbi:MAG: AraC family transcriptional regulator [Gemmatimonadales bacterium]